MDVCGKKENDEIVIKVRMFGVEGSRGSRVGLKKSGLTLLGVDMKESGVGMGKW